VQCLQYKKFPIYTETDKDPVSELMEQAIKCFPGKNVVDFFLDQQVGYAHSPEFTVRLHINGLTNTSWVGTAKNKKDANKEAAKKALEQNAVLKLFLESLQLEQ